MRSREVRTGYVTIYGLVDPAAPDIIRYVGKTFYEVKVRLRQHLLEARAGSRRRVSIWVAGLLSEGSKPLTVELVRLSLIEDWAAREKEIIAAHDTGMLLNRHPGGAGVTGHRRVRPPPAYASVARLLEYDPDTGVFKSRGRVAAGDVAGTLSRGYLYIRVEGERHFAHRLAWLMCHRRWPEAALDHIDLDKTNNRIANLRLATGTENGINTRRRVDNTSGTKGVYWHNGGKRWVAEIHRGGKKIYLGIFSRREDAASAYAEKARELFGNFARPE